MGLSYPIADTAREALNATRMAGAIADAKRLAECDVALVSDWLRPQGEEVAEVTKLASDSLSHGFVQTYEDANGAPVFAVSFWKPLIAKTEKAAADAPPDEDHTDDTYFTKPHLKRAKRKPRKRRVDPNQLDLFHGPDQKGYERRDPNNPGVVLVDEEGDGATFGGPASQEERQ